MTTTLDISSLSFESAEFDIDAGPVESPDQLEDPVYGDPHEHMLTIQGIYANISGRKYVCRDDIEQVKKLSAVYPSLEGFIRKFPVNSFSKEPSRINYEVSTESVLRTAFEATMKALRDIIDYIADALRAMWNYLTSAGQKTAAVDSLSDKLKACQSFIVEVDRVVSNSSLGEEFKRVREGAFNNEFHNLSGKWNFFKHLQLNKADDLHQDLGVLGGVIKTKLGPFAQMVDRFLVLVATAKTEDEVMMSINLVKNFDMSSAKLMKLARDYGYSPAVRVPENMTLFQSQSVVIRNQYKSWINDRSPLDRQQFNGLISSYAITPMADEVADTISWAKAQVEPSLKRIKEFSGKAMNPGLEEVYLKNISPFLKVLSSILSGFTAVEQCLGYLIENRNGVGKNVADAALGIVKKMDAFLITNKDKFTVAQQNVLWRQRKALYAVLK